MFFFLELHQEKRFSISFLNVGQGDAIFIETPNGVQVLVDGGSGAQVLRALQKVMPFFDRSIDVVIATHPDKDHIGGLPDVFRRFDVATYVESGVDEDNALYHALHEYVSEEGARHITIEKPLSFTLDGVVFDVLFPDRMLNEIEKNTASVVLRVSYKEHAFLLMGDAPKSVERYLVEKHGNSLQSNVLKVGHHGSKTSSGEDFIKTVSPHFGIISAGKDNRYNHPHKEVIDILTENAVSVLSTTEGSVEFQSDGHTLIKK